MNKFRALGVSVLVVLGLAAANPASARVLSWEF